MTDCCSGTNTGKSYGVDSSNCKVHQCIGEVLQYRSYIFHIELSYRQPGIIGHYTVQTIVAADLTLLQMYSIESQIFYQNHHNK